MSDTAREIRHLYRIIRNIRREMHDARRRRAYDAIATQSTHGPGRRFEGGDFRLVPLSPSARCLEQPCLDRPDHCGNSSNII
ncbi:hypothetical protein AAB992_37650 [Burkholderia contaminans]|uniref:hypothetical protein n=1 Tax=Burkholderia contaminans TaxID=488447 RepID=UPI002417B8A7|nr:hypothetical protein [Burkholderia contaminans]WFN12128.1 hypothetical protein LXE92_27850 [Burkholderia contaminans]